MKTLITIALFALISCADKPRNWNDLSGDTIYINKPIVIHLADGPLKNKVVVCSDDFRGNHLFTVVISPEAEGYATENVTIVNQPDDAMGYSYINEHRWKQ